MQNPQHFFWFLIGLVVSFLIPAVFGNNKNIPLDLYYLIYFISVGGFLGFYLKRNNINLLSMVNHNFILALVLTAIFSFLMVKNVLSMPATAQLSGSYLTWSVFWRGLVYGLVDGLLLSVFPFLVVWNAFGVSQRATPQKILFGLLVYVFVLIITSAYHLGYKDFRSKKVLKANIGNTLISTPTILSGNPISAPLTHAAMHISAVIHSPETELFLPPHWE